MKYLFCIQLLCLLGINKSWSTQYIIGSGQVYNSPNALFIANVLNNGDSIFIKAQTYTGIEALANWSKNNLYIKGINGKPHMKASGQNLNGKSIWITSGDSITLDNIEFSECTVPDENGAGIRHESKNLTVLHCYFHHNENGILTNNPNQGHIDIRFTEFAYNGFGDGFSHNVYIGHLAKLTFMYNYSHHANVGHNLKTRASENIIMYNRIMDETTGNSSRIIDVPNGGFTIIMGNVLMQGTQAVNNNLIGYGLEGLSNSINQLYVLNNTLVNKRVASCIYVSIQNGTTIAQIVNNIFAGTGTIVNGTTTVFTNNFTNTNIANVQFVNEANYDYHLQNTSPAINTGITLTTAMQYDLTPFWEYGHITNGILRYGYGIPDAGAYENRPICNTIFSTYNFTGTYNMDWHNAANWDNECVPPQLYNGVINISSNCIVKTPFTFVLQLNASLIVKAGKTLFWK